MKVGSMRSIKAPKWLKNVWVKKKSGRTILPKTLSGSFEHLEPREMLSGSNAVDRLDFGNLASEASHYFEPGFSADQMPIMGTGTVGASAGLTYREPTGSQVLTFTLAVDPNLQNYLTIRLWGNDVPGTEMNLQGVTSYENIEDAGGNVQFPNRFEYHTLPIPTTMTSGKTSVQLTLTFGGSGSTLDRPIYSVYTHTDPCFVPDSADPAGIAPAITGQATLDTLTEAEADNILLANRESIYNSGGYYDTIIARQAIVLNGDGTWSAPASSPRKSPV